MKTTLKAALAALFVATPVLAAEVTGDAAKGERAFKKCQACHVVADADGNVLAGRSGKTGPNLYGLPGRVAGTYEGFSYGDALVAAGEAGVTWDQETFMEYVKDPAKFLKQRLDDPGARSRMAFKVRKEKEAEDLYAFIASLSPAPAE